MNRFQHMLLVAVSLLIGLEAAAQETTSFKRLENNIQLTGGAFFETGTAATKGVGMVLGVSYGLDVRLNESWSVMPGAGVRFSTSALPLPRDGGGVDAVGFADVFCSARYHLGAGKTGIVLGLGPAFSYMVIPDYYHFCDDPNHPLGHKEKFNRFDVGLQPSILFRHGNHFQWGVAANVVLLNMRRQYPEHSVTGHCRFHYVALTCGWHF